MFGILMLVDGWIPMRIQVVGLEIWVLLRKPISPQ
jgi:hypothetical protein